MNRETKTVKEQPSRLAVDGSNKAAKGFAAVTQFVQPDKSSQSAGNGLPAQLKSGVEALSGLSMNDVRVSYNSPAPARVGALAYAKGNQIHIGPGQEQHLPHEAWHVVQQKQGRVKPTLQAKGFVVNDNPALEVEADTMGQRAAQLKTTGNLAVTPAFAPVSQYADVVQRKIGFEFQAVDSIFLKGVGESKKRLGRKGSQFEVQADGGTNNKPMELEILTTPVDETDGGRNTLVEIMKAINTYLLFVDHNAELVGYPQISWDNAEEWKESTKTFRDVFHRYATTDFAENKKLKEEGKTEKEQIAARKKIAEEFDPGLRTVPRYYIPGGKKHFHPQATVGVRFEKIAELIDYVTEAPIKKNDMIQSRPPGSKTKGEAGLPRTGAESKGPSPETKITGGDISTINKDAQIAAEVFGWGAKAYQVPYQRAWRAGFDKANSLKDVSAKVQGIAALFYGLAESQSDETQKQLGKTPNQPKYTMAFMLRTGFMPFFNNLSETDKESLKKIDTDALDVPIVQGKEAKHLERLTVKQIFVDMMSKVNGEKKDLLQEEKYVGHGGITDDEESKTKWGIANVQDIGISDKETHRAGAIIELRKLGSEVPAEGLAKFALAIFDLIMLINARPAPPGPPTVLRVPPPVPPPPPYDPPTD
jgi:hypothetical protein